MKLALNESCKIGRLVIDDRTHDVLIYRRSHAWTVTTTLDGDEGVDGGTAAQALRSWAEANPDADLDVYAEGSEVRFYE